MIDRLTITPISSDNPNDFCGTFIPHGGVRYVEHMFKCHQDHIGCNVHRKDLSLPYYLLSTFSFSKVKRNQHGT